MEKSRMIITDHFEPSLFDLEGLVYWVTFKVLTARLGLTVRISQKYIFFKSLPFIYLNALFAVGSPEMISFCLETYTSWVTQKLPQTYTVILRICIGKVA